MWDSIYEVCTLDKQKTEMRFLLHVNENIKKTDATTDLLSTPDLF